MKKTSLGERLENGGVICAEGFLFEVERRGYMASGAFVPEVALENPAALSALHRDFQHAGSDAVQAFTYNGHREKNARSRQRRFIRAAQPRRFANCPRSRRIADRRR